MTTLRIQTFGPGLHLLVGIITPAQMIQLEKACPRFFGLYLKSGLNRLWYGNRDVMKQILGVDHWSEVYEPSHRYYGPVLQNRAQIRSFIDNLDIYVDGTRIDTHERTLSHRVKGLKPLPTPPEKRIIVFHGEHYSGYSEYTHRLHDRLDTDRFRLEFSDCGDNGLVLSRLVYGDRALIPEVSSTARRMLRLQFSVLSPDAR